MRVQMKTYWNKLGTGILILLGLRWKPKDGELYYYVYRNDDGIDISPGCVWRDDYVDRNTFSKVKLFKTKQEAANYIRSKERYILERL